LKKHLLVVVLALFGALTGCEDAVFPYLTSIAVNPATPSVAAGSTQQFTAQGTFSNNSTNDVSSQATWTSSDPSVATIDTTGLATTYAPGTTTITATVSALNGVLTATTTLTVTTPTLTSVVVTDLSSPIALPTSAGTFQIARGTSHQFLAYGIYSDGGERDITTSVTWLSAPVTVATITNAGLAKGILAGSATITATDPTTSISGTATLNVTSATVSTIAVAPAVQTIAPLTHLAYTAIGTFSDATVQDVTADVNWSSSNTAAATISNSAPNGVATSIAAGTTTITAALGAATASQTLTISSATLSKITLTPTSSSTAPVGMAVGSTLLLNAVGTFSDGTTQPLNAAVGWSVPAASSSTASVNGVGVVTGLAVGSATVIAKFGAVTQTAFINVENVTSLAMGPTGPTISPTAVTIAQGTATEFSAIATLTDGSTQDISSSVTWVSTNPSIATISNALASPGWAAGVAPGSTTIAASFPGVNGSDGLTVTNATLSSLAIATPATAQNIALGTAQAYTVTGTFSDSSTQDLSTQVKWTSSDTAVAIINQYGVATSTGTGTTNIAAAGNINGSTATSPVQVLTVH
jgi:hypothetical protein